MSTTHPPTYSSLPFGCNCYPFSTTNPPTHPFPSLLPQSLFLQHHPSPPFYCTCYPFSTTNPPTHSSPLRCRCTHLERNPLLPLSRPWPPSLPPCSPANPPPPPTPLPRRPSRPPHRPLLPLPPQPCPLLPPLAPPCHPLLPMHPRLLPLLPPSPPRIATTTSRQLLHPAGPKGPLRHNQRCAQEPYTNPAKTMKPACSGAGVCGWGVRCLKQGGFNE